MSEPLTLESLAKRMWQELEAKFDERRFRSRDGTSWWNAVGMRRRRRGVQSRCVCLEAEIRQTRAGRAGCRNSYSRLDAKEDAA